MKRLPLLLAALAIVVAGCSDETDDPATPDPSSSASEPSVDETFEPADCTLPDAAVDQDTVAQVVYAMPTEPLAGVTMESAVATPGGADIELSVVREADGCTGTAAVTGPADEQYDVLGLTLEIGRPVPSEGDESRAAIPVRVVAAR